MDRVVIAGVAATRFGYFPERSTSDLVSEAVTAAAQDAGCELAEVQSVFFSNSAEGAMSGQHAIRGQVALRRTGLLGKPIANVENACASGSTAFRQAYIEVLSGSCDIAIAIGVEKMSYADRGALLQALNSGTAVDDLPSLRERVGGHAERSIFMDLYAAQAVRRIERGEITNEDLARVVVKSRRAGSLNPRAQFQQPTSVEEVLAARAVAGPLTLPMCSPVGDGAAAVVLMSSAEARRRSVDLDPVFVRASVLASGFDGEEGEAAAARAARAAYEASGIEPRDVDVAEVHDATASAELALYEDLGFCGRGESAGLLRDCATGVNGRIAVNSGGGLLSRGHPIGATGCAQIVELTEQLRGTAGDRQREGARVALAENGGGWLGEDAAVAVVTVLSN